MLLGSRGSRMRCLSVWFGVTTVAAVVDALAIASVRRAPPWSGTLSDTPIDVALVQVAALALLGCATWAWVTATIVIGIALRGGEASARSPRGVPAGLRRLVLAACGVALVGGLAAQPSYADSARHPATPGSPHSLVGLPLPDRAVAPPDPPDPPTPAVARVDPGRVTDRDPARTVRVRAGDSLWSIAADDLPPGSSNGEIAHHWQAIYAANRVVIGSDPDLIAPGQLLRLPRKDAS